MHYHTAGRSATRCALFGIWALLCASAGNVASADMPENPLGLRVHHITALVGQLPRAIGITQYWDLSWPNRASTARCNSR